MVRGFSRFVLFLFLGLLRAPTRGSATQSGPFPKKVGNTRVWKPPGLASPKSACYRGPKPQKRPKWLGEGAKGVLDPGSKGLPRVVKVGAKVGQNKEFCTFTPTLTPLLSSLGPYLNPYFLGGGPEPYFCCILILWGFGGCSSHRSYTTQESFARRKPCFALAQLSFAPVQEGFGALGPKDLLHPLLTTLGTFEVSGPCSRHPGWQLHRDCLWPPDSGKTGLV